MKLCISIILFGDGYRIGMMWKVYDYSVKIVVWGIYIDAIKDSDSRLWEELSCCEGDSEWNWDIQGYLWLRYEMLWMRY